MAFHLTAEDIRLRDGHILVARLEPNYWAETEIELNEHLGNINGHFKWEMRNFSHSARNMVISFESLNSSGDESDEDTDDSGRTKVPILRGQLADDYGEWQDAAVSLAERIMNLNGAFAYGKAMNGIFALGASSSLFCLSRLY